MSLDQLPLPAPAPDVLYQALQDGAVLFSPSNEIYFGLNHVGARIWELLPPATRTLDELVDRVAASYPDAPPDRIRRDAQALLADLGYNGLVVDARGAGAAGAGRADGSTRGAPADMQAAG